MSLHSHFDHELNSPFFDLAFNKKRHTAPTEKKYYLLLVCQYFKLTFFVFQNGFKLVTFTAKR